MKAKIIDIGMWHISIAHLFLYVKYHLKSQRHSNKLKGKEISDNQHRYAVQVDTIFFPLLQQGCTSGESVQKTDTQGISM